MIATAIVTISDSVVRGTREDRSGVALRERIQALGWTVRSQTVVADEIDQIASKITELAGSAELALILTTGGTGVALRDVTPEATRTVIDREIPGIGEVMRAEGRRSTRFAA